jgi:glycosyltransferase involved in cell wall biosynthesis
MRILHAARNIANQPGYTVAALRRLGYEAEVWEYGPANAFEFPVDRRIPLDRRDPRIFWDTFQDAIDRFDVFHFHFGRSLFPDQWGGVPPLWDLPIYRALGKKVFFTFHGSDCRIRAVHLERNPWSYYRTSDIASDDDRTQKVIQAIRTYADRMFIVSPDYFEFIPDAVVMPRVIDLTEWPVQDPVQREVPVVLHVPSRRGTKGTERILAGLEALKAEGVPFEMRLLEGVPHDEARRAIQDADIVVDNVITGDYEVVSIEAMASGRVAVANVFPEVAAAYPSPPVYSVTPDDFVARMRSLVADVDGRRALAARGRDYVAAVHDASVIAARLVPYYEAPSSPVVQRTFPDWLSLEPQRKIEHLDAMLMRAQAREADLRRRLGLPVDEVGDLRTSSEKAKDVLPDRIRLPLRRARADLRTWLGRRRR